MPPDDTTHDWHFLRSTVRERLGKLTLREDVWRLPTGVEKTYPILHVGPTVGVVPFVDPAHVLLIRQFRHLIRGDSWELPGGGGQPGETPEAAAQRELQEEGGYRAGRLVFLTRFVPSAAASAPSIASPAALAARSVHRRVGPGAGAPPGSTLTRKPAPAL